MAEPREGRVQTKFQPKTLEILASVTPEMNYKELEANLLRLAKEELGETSCGGQFIEKEKWWWNQQETTKAKKNAFEKWQLSREEQGHEQYKFKKKESRKAVTIAKENAYEDLYQKRYAHRLGSNVCYSKS